MRSADIFTGRYLRAADLKGGSTVVTIARVELQKVGDTKKAVAYFAGKDKGMILNRTNFTAIEAITGEYDTDRWSGRQIRLIVTDVDFQGRRVPAIRIEAAK